MLVQHFNRLNTTDSTKKKTMGWTPGPMRTPTPLTSKLKTPPTCDLRNKFETINRANLNRMSKKELMRMYIRCVPNHNCKTESDVEKAGLTVSMLQEQIQNQVCCPHRKSLMLLPNQ